MNDILKGVIAYKAIDHYVTSADARLADRANAEKLAYLQRRDSELQEYESKRFDRNMAFQSSQQRDYMSLQRDQMDADRRRHDDDLYHEREMQEREHEMRTAEMVNQRKIAHENAETSRAIAALKYQVELYNADRDREVLLEMRAKELDQNEQLEMRRLHVQQNIIKQSNELQRYLAEQGIKSEHEIQRFKALAMRETQILLARENACNILQDRFVQEALKTFPLNISPIVLLRNRPHSLTGLLRFSSRLTPESGLPNIVQVYNDVKSYSENPEALNVFIAPIHIDSKIQNREELSQQIWDSIYQNIERFFTIHYNRRGTHPVILYPTAWKDKTMMGQHTSETMHFFLKDMPSMVIEPRFDGHSFSLMLSMWGLGYSSEDHIRTEMHFDANLDAMLIQSAYLRSKRSLSILEELGDKVSGILSEKKAELERNVEYYENLRLDEKIGSNNIDDISAVGAYNLFSIDPVQDMAAATEMISDLLCMNLAVLADVHHLQATDIPPVFPSLFKENFPKLYEDKDLREVVFKCYERIYIFLRNEDAGAVGASFKREMERVRELQITNLQKQLELIDEQELSESIEDRLRKYIDEKYGIRVETIDELWQQAIEKMTIDDIPFFAEILPNITDRRRFKLIDKKMADLKRL